MPDTTPTAREPDSDAHFRAVLRQLVDQGAVLLTALVRDPNCPASAKAAAYERYIDSVHHSIALARHISDHPAVPRPAPPTRGERRNAERRAVLHDVATAIVERAERPQTAQSLREELYERLDDPQFELDLATRPVAELIEEIKQDLGLANTADHRYPRRTPADIRALNARAAAPPAKVQPPDFPHPKANSDPDPDIDDIDRAGR